MLKKSLLHREYYNPLRGLSMSRIVSMEDMAKRGQWADLQWFWLHMEEFDVVIRSAIERRLSFVDRLDWEIRTVDNADPILAKDQSDVLRSVYEDITNLKEATRFLAYSTFRGFSHLEKVYNSDRSSIIELAPIEQWFWVRDGFMGDWLFNPDASAYQTNGKKIKSKDFIVMETSLPANYSIGRLFFSKTLCMADWDTALEAGSVPSIFVTMPPGISPDTELEYQTLAENVCSNLRGSLPNGSSITTLDPASRSRLPYQERIDYSDKMIVMSSTGGKLTMLTESGSGTLAGGAHSQTMLDLANSDSSRISEVLQENIDQQVLNAYFPGRDKVAYFQFDPLSPEDPNALMQSVANLAWSGYTVDQAQLAEKTGLKIIPLAPQEQ